MGFFFFFLLGSYINRSCVKMSERKLNYYIYIYFFFRLTEDDWTFLWSVWTDFYSVPRHLVITWKSLRLSIWFFFSFSGGGWIQAKAIFGIECRLLFFVCGSLSVLSLVYFLMKRRTKKRKKKKSCQEFVNNWTFLRISKAEKKKGIRRTSSSLLINLKKNCYSRHVIL